MIFGIILEEIKDGTKRAHRTSWHPTRYIYIERDKRIPNEVLRDPQKLWFRGYDMNIFSHFNLVEDHNVIVGWNPSTEDILANDWEVE